MPIIQSAKKRVRVAKKASIRNGKTKRLLKSAVKSFQSNLENSKTKAASAHRKAQSELGKAAKKHVLHKNKAARKQRQLAKAAKAAGVNLNTGTKKTAPKAPAKKKAIVKTSPVKKTVAKKPTAKKVTTKKK